MRLPGVEILLQAQRSQPAASLSRVLIGSHICLVRDVVRSQFEGDSPRFDLLERLFGDRHRSAPLGGLGLLGGEPLEEIAYLRFNEFQLAKECQRQDIRSLVAEIETSKDKSEEYARSLEEKVRERTRQLEEVSKTDPLTGLLNVGQLEEVLTGMLHSARKRSEPMTVCYIDVNDFKKINDTLGHQRGDAVLRSVAAAIVRVARAEDRCFRYGGDEFCVVLSNTTEAQAHETFERRLTAEISRLRDPVSVSIGFCGSMPPDYDSPQELIRNADGRMYLAKRTSRPEDSTERRDREGLGEPAVIIAP